MERVTKPLVTIRCITYNHEPYIRQCLDGFIMQKTNFRFEAIVHDDASTDGTADIIREYAEKYPEIIKPILQTENQYSKRDGSIRRILNENTHGKYVALCEGDDYWIDPLKLQKQVDFMEKHEDYSMCFHNAYEIFEHKNVEKKLFSNIEDKDYTGVDIYKDWIVPTASTLFRREILSSELYLKAIENKTFIYGDIVLFLSCANYGKLRGMSDIMSVYRRHENGITYQLNTHQKQYTLLLHQLEIYKYFGKEYKTVSLYYFQRGCFTIFNGSLKKEFKDIQFRFLLIGLKESILYGIYNYSKLTFPAIIKRLSGRKSINHHE